jgi:hypothetical protein
MIDSLQLAEPQTPEPSLAWFNGARLLENVDNAIYPQKDIVSLTFAPDFLVGKALQKTIGPDFYEDIVFLLNRINSLPPEDYASYVRWSQGASDPICTNKNEPLRLIRTPRGLKRHHEGRLGYWHKPLHWTEDGQVLNGAPIPEPSHPAFDLSKFDETSGQWVQYVPLNLKRWVKSQTKTKSDVDKNYLCPARLCPVKFANNSKIRRWAPEGTKHLTQRFSGEFVDPEYETEQSDETHQQVITVEDLQRAADLTSVMQSVDAGKIDAFTVRAEYLSDLKTETENAVLIREAKPQKRKLAFGFTRVTRKGKTVGVKTVSCVRTGDWVWFVSKNKLPKVTVDDMEVWNERLAKLGMPEDLFIGGREVRFPVGRVNAHDKKQWEMRVKCKFAEVENPQEHSDWDLEVRKAEMVLDNRTLADVTPEGADLEPFKKKIQRLDDDFGIEPLDTVAQRLEMTIRGEIVDAIEQMNGDAETIPEARRILALHRKKYVTARVARVRREAKAEGLAVRSIQRRVKEAQEQANTEFDRFDGIVDQYPVWREEVRKLLDLSTLQTTDDEHVPVLAEGERR